MTLEDFFTSTELKEGLTTPTRVNDLITVIQNQKEYIVKNVSEASQQWSAVANTIAATESKECLELFIQLDGLVFINKWLNDSQNLIDDIGTSLLEELVVALLRALERLQVDHHHSVGSGVGLTVQGLVGHSSLTVREKAKDLCDKWAPVQNNDGEPTNVDSVNFNEEKVTVQQETDKDEIVTQEVVKESATEITESESLEDANEKQKVDSVTTLSSTLEDTTLTSSTDVVHGLESVTKTETRKEKTNKDEDMVNGRESQSPVLPTTTPDVSNPSGSGDSASGGDGSENPKSSSNTESDEDEKKDTGIESDGNSGSPLPVSKQSAKSQNEDLITKRPSDMELDYGMVDPLELARQVANEVELEVDSPEQSCSTSTSEKEHRSSPGLGHEVSSGPAPAPVLEPEPKSKPMINSETLDNSTLDPEKGFSGFDLNEDVAFEETECQVGPPLTPVSVVAAANGPPVAPLQFEGTLGWKGSAATSAFRRIPEGEKTFSSSSSHSNSTQRLTHFDFDLNVAEASEDKIQLDLNSLGDSDASIVTLDWKRETRVTPLKQNGPHSPSVSSSMQPSYRNIDLNLNDHLTVPNNASSNNPFLGKLFNNTQDESVISIFGTQVEVNCKDHNNHYIPPVQSNGRLLEPSVDFNLGRSGSGLGLGLGSSIPYSNVPAYGYTHNGFTMGPMYAPPGAPILYMVDSRGAPIIPPIQPIQPAFSQHTQPFFFNMGAAPSASNGAGPSRHAIDLDSGFVTDRGNNINHNGGLRQFLNHDQASSSTRGDNIINHNGGLRQFLNHDQASSSTRGNNINHNGGLRQFLNHDQASSGATIGGKRDQPDSGWDLFLMNYKHQQPPWQ
ncbi:uncharacterized protein LOC143607567 [Bidens hawaiensis]|uniref:uncharacterized protein LOC143607567 n=1 Tax=Bidens hawaiensis TaxID=980011 RepID=UPI0040491B70